MDEPTAVFDVSCTQGNQGNPASPPAIVLPAFLDCRPLHPRRSEFHLEQYRQKRRLLLEEMRCANAFAYVIAVLNRDAVYRIVVPEGRLLQKGRDGFFRGVFYGNRGIEGHAKFVQVGPTVFELAKTAGCQVLLISIALQLNHIQDLVEGVQLEFHRDRIAEIMAGVDQFEQAILVGNESTRNQLIANSIQSLSTGLRKTLAELKVRITDVPDPADRILDHLRPGRRKTEVAERLMRLAEESFAASVLGIRTLAECFAVLDESDAAAEAVRHYYNTLIECDIAAAAAKARLLPVKGGHLPQEPWIRLEKAHRSAELGWNVLTGSGHLGGAARVAIDFVPSEIEGGNDGNLP